LKLVAIDGKRDQQREEADPSQQGKQKHHRKPRKTTSHDQSPQKMQQQNPLPYSRLP
jgi:hypothetical protein